MNTTGVMAEASFHTPFLEELQFLNTILRASKGAKQKHFHTLLVGMQKVTSILENWQFPTMLNIQYMTQQFHF